LLDDDLILFSLRIIENEPD